MSVVSVKERHDERASAVADGITTHTRSWIVVNSDAADGTAVALNANDGTTAVPAYGAIYAGCRCRSKDAKPHEDSTKIFIVTAEYSSDNGTWTMNAIEPLDRPADVSYDASEQMEEYFRDKDSKPVTSSSGYPFETNPTRDASEGFITIVRNESDYNDVTAEGFKDTINSAAIVIKGTTYAARTLKMSPIKAQEVTETVNQVEYTYWRVTYTLKKRIAGWDDKFEDKASYEKVSGKWVQIRDSQGMSVTRPWPLDGSGSKKTSPTDTPAVLTFKPYSAVSWTGFNFPAA